MDRRAFLSQAAWMAGGLAFIQGGAFAKTPASRISCNQYTWFTYLKRENVDFSADLPDSLARVARTGVGAFEASAGSGLEFIERLAPVLKEKNLAMPSLYVNSTLHEADKAQQSIDAVLRIAARAKELLGTKILVTNPSPIKWGGAENKTDAQLEVQAQALDRLGAALREAGQVLAYHNHDIELRLAGREFHHMLTGTRAENVKFCLDAHWVYRGAGNSQLALFDAVKHYLPRIVELHIRQSRDGVWNEVFGEGDIDYARLVNMLKAEGLQPHVVLEQAVEKGTPQTLDAQAALDRSVKEVERIFGAFLV